MCRLSVKTVWFQTIQFSIRKQFKYKQTVLFQAIQFCISTKFSSIWPVYIITLLYIGLVGRVFANGPGDRGSIPSRFIQKTQKWY